MISNIAFLCILFVIFIFMRAYCFHLSSFQISVFTLLFTHLFHVYRGHSSYSCTKTLSTTKLHNVFSSIVHIQYATTRHLVYIICSIVIIFAQGNPRIAMYMYKCLRYCQPGSKFLHNINIDYCYDDGG